MSGLTGFIVVLCWLQCADTQITAWTEAPFTVTVGTGSKSITASVTAKIPENSAVATTLFSAVATKTGAGAIVYAIASGNTGSVFEIDTAGAVKLAAGKSLDFETTPSYTLQITAMENGKTAAGETGTAILTVNIKNILEFGKTTYAVCMADGATAGTTVGTYTVSDNTAGAIVTYAIASGNTNTDFALTSGVLKVASGKTLAKITTATYTLALSATESGGQVAGDGSTTVTVTVGTCGCSGVAATFGVTLLAMVVAVFA